MSRPAEGWSSGRGRLVVAAGFLWVAANAVIAPKYGVVSWPQVLVPLAAVVVLVAARARRGGIAPCRPLARGPRLGASGHGGGGARRDVRGPGAAGLLDPVQPRLGRRLPRDQHPCHRGRHAPRRLGGRHLGGLPQQPPAGLAHDPLLAGLDRRRVHRRRAGHGAPQRSRPVRLGRASSTWPHAGWAPRDGVRRRGLLLRVRRRLALDRGRLLRHGRHAPDRRPGLRLRAAARHQRSRQAGPVGDRRAGRGLGLRASSPPSSSRSWPWRS